ncbi:hypothetical protein D3C87_1698650 [compost metagenome]
MDEGAMRIGGKDRARLGLAVRLHEGVQRRLKLDRIFQRDDDRPLFQRRAHQVGEGGGGFGRAVGLADEDIADVVAPQGLGPGDGTASVRPVERRQQAGGDESGDHGVLLNRRGRCRLSASRSPRHRSNGLVR